MSKEHFERTVPGGALRWTALALALLCALQLPWAPADGTGEGRAAAPSWPMEGCNAQHTHRSIYDTSLNPGGIKWVFEDGVGFSAGPIIGPDDTVYLGSEGSYFYAINADGSQKWVYRTAGVVMTCAGLDSAGNICFGTLSGVVQSLDASGLPRWSISTGASIYSGMTVGSTDMIYFGTSHSTMPDYLYAVYPNGTVKWQYTLGKEDRYSTPALGPDGTIYVGCVNSKLYAIAPNGTQVWNYTAGSSIVSSPAVASDGTVYVVTDVGKLYALRSNGSLKWTFSMGNLACSSPAIAADGTVYVASTDGYFYAVATDGMQYWRAKIGNDICTAAIGADGRIYVGNTALEVYTPEGTRGWKTGPYGILSGSPAIGSDGTVYFSDEDGNLVAVGTPPPPVPTLPSAPRNLRTSSGMGQVYLDWDVPSSTGNLSLLSYRLFRGDTASSMQLLTEVGPSATDYTDTNMTGGRTYYYAVTAVNSIGEGPASYPASARPSVRPVPDTTPPEIIITYPVNNSIVTSSYLRVRGTAYDNGTTSGTNYIRVEASRDGVRWDRVSGTYSWSYTVDLVDGRNTFYFRAVDSSGNIGNASLTVIYRDPDKQPAPPPPTWLYIFMALAGVLVFIVIGIYMMKAPRYSPPQQGQPPRRGSQPPRPPF